MSLSDTYRASATDFLAVVADLEPDRFGTPVPACPRWSVHDLLAHQSGASNDFVTRNLEGVTSEPWTARQVDARKGWTTEALAAEWSANIEAVAALCDLVPGPNPAWDVSVHVADLREALDLSGPPETDGWSEVLAAATALVAQRGITISVEEDGADEGGTVFHFATAYGLWRALFSRLGDDRLRAEMLRGDMATLAQVAFFAP